jgi:hypothetical protein
MKTKGDRRKILKRIVIAVAIAVFVGPALCILYHFLLPLYIRGFVFFAFKEALQRKVRLLSETDHQALLEDCRELSRQVGRPDLPLRYFIRIHPDPEISRFPQLILDLEPTYVQLYSDGRVEVELIGATHHCGVVAYPEDYKKPSDSFSYGDRKVVDGLWYYEDDYNEALDKRIEELMQKRK